MIDWLATWRATLGFLVPRTGIRSKRVLQQAGTAFDLSLESSVARPIGHTGSRIQVSFSESQVPLQENAEELS